MSSEIQTFLNDELTDKAKRALDRMAEAFPGAPIPSGVSKFAGAEAPIHDLYMNLKRQLEAGKVEKADKLLIATALASATGSQEATSFFATSAIAEGVSKQQISDAIGVASTCSIFNQYYHFKSMAGEDFKNMKANFNANTFMQTSLNLAQTEMICVAVSSLNNCHLCVEGHLNKAKDAGVTTDQLDEVIKVLSVVAAFSQVSSSLS